VSAPGEGDHRGLLVDFGGVLTTNVFDAFRTFAEREGLEPDAVKRLFRENPEARRELRRLERGELGVPEFERRFGPLLGVEETEGLVDRLFSEMGPAHTMISAVRRAREAGVLRPDVTTTDLHLLIEQLGKSPMIDQLRRQGRTDLVDAATNARARINAIALDGLRAGAPGRLPGTPPDDTLLSARWERPPV
jgi:hypothetical protein